MAFVFWNNTRLFILLLSLWCLTLTQINSQIFTFTVICMDDIKENVTDHWIDSSSDKNILFSATAVGAILGIIPAVPLLHHHGVRQILTFSGLFSAIGTILFPAAVDFVGYYGVMLCRVLQGFGISMILTLVGVIPRSWSPEEEASTYLAILSCAFQFNNIVFMPISGFLCDSSWGWRSIFYLFGIVTFLCFGLFYYFYTDLPKLHKNVSSKELEKIETGKKEVVREACPYFAICMDPCVLFAWISFMGGNLGFMTLLLYGPTYLREVLHFDVKSTGFINAFPYILCAIFKFVVGKVSDKITGISEKTRFTGWMVFSILGLALGYIVMAYTDDRLIAQIAFTFAIVACGLIIMATIRCLQLRTLQHCHFAVSAISFLSYFVQFIAPIGVAIICPDNTPEQWSKLFIVVTCIMIATNIPFPFMTTQNAAEYTKNKNNNKVDDIVEKF